MTQNDPKWLWLISKMTQSDLEWFKKWLKMTQNDLEWFLKWSKVTKYALVWCEQCSVDKIWIGWIGSDRIGLFISVCGFNFTWFSIWFSVFLKIQSNRVFHFFSGLSSIWPPNKHLHWSRTAARRKWYWEECVTRQLSLK